jgi:hypothetical protein
VTVQPVLERPKLTSQRECGTELQEIPDGADGYFAILTISDFGLPDAFPPEKGPCPLRPGALKVQYHARRWRKAMNSNEFRDFAELYRAAYAEPAQEKKSVLLREVRKAIEQRIQEPKDELLNHAEAA